MKRATRLFGIGALLIVVCLTVGLTPAFAKNVTGTIVAMDGGMLVVRTQDGQEQHFTLGVGVTVPANVQNGSMVELTVGDTSDQATMVSEITLAAGTTSSTASTYNSPSSTTTPPATGAASTSESESAKPYANTASPIWAFALMGLAAVAGAIGLRRLRESHG